MAESGGITSALLVLAARPSLWPTAARMAPPGWWRRWPPRPWPPADYVHFRTETMYGGLGGKLAGADLVAYLQWCRRMRYRAR